MVYILGSKTYSASTDPSGQDTASRRKDVDEAAVVGVVGDGVGAVGGTHGADGGLGGRGEGAGIGGAITGGDGEEDAAGDEVGGGSVDGGRVGSAQGHVGKGAVRAPAAGGVSRDVVDAGNDAGVGAGAAVAKDLDAVQGRVLGYAVRGATDGAGDVCPVAVAVSVVGADKGGNLGSTTTEVLCDRLLVCVCMLGRC
jgi:hypothetical protein